MSPERFEHLQRLRRRLVERRRMLASFEAGEQHCFTNGVDDSNEFMGKLRGWIESDIGILASFDPDDLTVLGPNGDEA